MANKFYNVIDLNLNKVINVANGTADNDVVNLGQMNAAISTVVGDLSSALEYKGTIVLDAESTLASFPVDASKGDFYIINEVVEGPITIDGRDYNNGDHVVFNQDVVGAATTASMDLIKNTEFPDMVFTDATQTLTNKTIDADSNTISNLEVDNFKTGVLNTDLDNSVGTDTELASALAIQTHVATEIGALETKVTNLLYSAEIVGDDVTVNFVVNHALNSTYPIVQVIEVATNAIVYPAVVLTDANNVTIAFGIAPAGESVPEAGDQEKFRVIVWGTNFPA